MARKKIWNNFDMCPQGVRKKYSKERNECGWVRWENVLCCVGRVHWVITQPFGLQAIQWIMMHSLAHFFCSLDLNWKGNDDSIFRMFCVVVMIIRLLIKLIKWSSFVLLMKLFDKKKNTTMSKFFVINFFYINWLWSISPCVWGILWSAQNNNVNPNSN